MSGKGIHIITIAKLPTLPGETGKKIPQPELERFGDVIPKVEVYDERRFFVVTGNRITGCPVIPGGFQSGIESFWERFIKKPTSTPIASSYQPNSSRHDDEEKVIRRARAYIATIDGAVSGNFGHDATFHVACVLVIGFGLDLETAFQLLAEWNVRCAPPGAITSCVTRLRTR